jgi:indole-3-glycerol phosphate synthase
VRRTSGFLERIVPEVQRSAASPRYLAGLPETPSRAAASLRAAIDAARPRFARVAEFKRVSPGSPDAPRLAPPSPSDFVRQAEAGGACALSCLATEPEFEGSPRDVAAVTAAARTPVLFKDFVVEPIQIEAARRAGAAAVLLIARLETEGRLSVPLADLARDAHRAGLEVLLEFHHRGELKLAESVPADVFGVNVRDLDSLKLRPDRAAETLRAAAALRPLLALSGSRGPEDARHWRALGADGVLVGTSLQRAADPAAFLESLAVPVGGRA